MPVDLKSFKKLETPSPEAQAGTRGDGQRLLVLVKLRDGASQPTYIVPRAKISAQIFSVELPASDLQRLESDPAVESVSISRRLPLL
jgi:hypothetical protein